MMITRFNLQQGQASDRQETAHVVDLLENRTSGETVCTSVCLGVVGDQQTNADNAVVDQRDPRAPAPADLQIAVGPQLHVQEVRAEGEDEGSDQC